MKAPYGYEIWEPKSVGELNDAPDVIVWFANARPTARWSMGTGEFLSAEIPAFYVVGATFARPIPISGYLEIVPLGEFIPPDYWIYSEGGWSVGPGAVAGYSVGELYIMRGCTIARPKVKPKAKVKTKPEPIVTAIEAEPGYELFRPSSIDEFRAPGVRSYWLYQDGRGWADCGWSWVNRKSESAALNLAKHYLFERPIVKPDAEGVCEHVEPKPKPSKYVPRAGYEFVPRDYVGKIEKEWFFWSNKLESWLSTSIAGYNYNPRCMPIYVRPIKETAPKPSPELDECERTLAGLEEFRTSEIDFYREARDLTQCKMSALDEWLPSCKSELQREYLRADCDLLRFHLDYFNKLISEHDEHLTTARA